MEFSELNTLEKIGLTFTCGFIAGQSLEKVDVENEEEKVECEGKHFKQNDKELNVSIEKLEGDRAKEFIKFIKKITGEEN